MLCSPLNENINTSILKDYFLKIPTGRQGILAPAKEQKHSQESSGKQNKIVSLSHVEKGIFLSPMISRKAR